MDGWRFRWKYVTLPFYLLLLLLFFFFFHFCLSLCKGSLVVGHHQNPSFISRVHFSVRHKIIEARLHGNSLCVFRCLRLRDAEHFVKLFFFFFSDGAIGRNIKQKTPFMITHFCYTFRDEGLD